ncbi:MAG: hypothetical protein M1828_004290 [Chrysothrix sp. TS-e1954]|nr:MAG: hypothetical protein M1828_004290 [Chrysothrix sp. TS-e1954]
MTLPRPPADPLSANEALLQFPSDLLRRELLKRQDDEQVTRPACGSGPNRRGYNTSAHVFALFLILTLSTLATAFVHLLPTAFTSLTDPCLPRFWNEGYPAMAGLVAMTSVLVVVGVEMTFAIRGAGHVHGGGEYDILEESHTELKEGSRPSLGRLNSFAGNGAGFEGIGATHGEAFHDDIRSPRVDKPLPPRPQGDGRPSDLEEDDESDGEPFEDAEDSAKPLNGYVPWNRRRDHTSRGDTQSPGDLRPTNSTRPEPLDASHEGQRLLLQCLLLEAGILFHSVFIGMAVSVAVGTPFVVLLIAISFHQTFEGLALGARIAAIPQSVFPPASPRPWLMTLAYGTTTPIGQAIGLLVHNLYDPESEVGLLMVGFMNAISSGLLLFAGLVELLAEDFLAEKSYSALQGKKRLEACGAVVAGSLLMALVGAWA